MTAVSYPARERGTHDKRTLWFLILQRDGRNPDDGAYYAELTGLPDRIIQAALWTYRTLVKAGIEPARLGSWRRAKAKADEIAGA